MDFKIIFICAFVVLYSSAAHLPRPVLHVPPVYARTFLRDSVEHRPSELYRKSERLESLSQTLEEFGTKSLPLRSAVEHVPEGGHKRLPLRDAVERRIVPSDILTSSELDDVRSDVQFRYSHLTPYSSFIRFQDVVNLPVAPQLFVVPQPYRIDNPYQQIVDISQARRGGLRALRRGRSFNQLARFEFANRNLEGYYQVPSARISEISSNPRIVCYIRQEAVYRKEPMTFSVQDLDPFACTHVIYAYATIDPHNYAIIPRDHEYDVIKGGYRAATGLKQLNPNLKVLISIGGDLPEASRKFSRMVATPSHRANFIRSLIGFLEEFSFDGIDLHWMYPGTEELGVETTDKENYEALLNSLYDVFKPNEYVLSVGVPGSRFKVEDGFNVEMLAKMVDFVNLEAFDMNSEKGGSCVDHPAPLMKRESDKSTLDSFLNVDYAVRYWLKKGMPRHKINLGIPFFGRAYSLKTSDKVMLGQVAKGPGKPGFYTQEPGKLAYYEVCDSILNDGWVVGRDSIGSPYAQHEDQWVGYDDPQSIEKKMQYIKDLGLGGASIHSLDTDDFRGLCGEKYPLLSVIRRSLQPKLPNSIPSNKNSDLESGRCEKQGLYSDPTDCAAYYVCRSGYAYHVKCKEDTMFDFETGKCSLMAAEKCRPGMSLHVAPRFKSNLQKDEKKVVCYATNWAFYRKGDGKFVPEHLDQRLCTHIIWAFGSLEPEQLMIKEFDPWADIDNNLYERITAVPDTPVLLALGGWTDSNGDKYSRLVSDGAARRRFILSAVSFLRRHNFAGMQIDWNYPVCWQSNCQKGPQSDKPNFTKLIQELKTEFDKQEPKLLLSVAISGYKEVIDVAYELDKIGKEVEFMSVMTYDYHGAWEKKTGHVSPLYHRQGDRYEQYNTNYTMEYLVKNGAPREKLLMGVPFYGQTFTLPQANGPKEQGALATGPGEPGEFTKQPGMLAYYEICYRVKSQNWMVSKDPQKATGPFAYYKDQFVSYDDPESIKDKADYILKSGFGGAVAWTVDLDDFNNRCCKETFPLLKALNRGLGLLKTSAPSTTDCTKPPEPITPAPPTLTTGVDTGASMSPTTPSSWQSSSSRPTTSSTTSQPSPTTSQVTWWTTEKSTTTKPVTWWSQTSTQSTTTSPWWTTEKTSTTTASTTTAPTSTTGKPSTTEKVTTSTSAPSSTIKPDMTTIPAPAVVMPANDPVPGPSCETGTYLPDPKNCNAYYRCVLGELRKQYCAGGLHWNKRRLACDWPATAKCKESAGSGTNPPSLMTTQRITTEKLTTQRTVGTTRATRPTRVTTTTMKATTPQGGNCVNGQYYQHEVCNMFYVCVNGVKVQQSCGPGLHWDKDKGSCDWAFKGECKRKRVDVKNQFKQTSNRFSADYTQSSVKATPYAPCEEGTFAQYPGDCSRYMQCLWGKYETYNCASGLHWNKVQNTCDWPEKSKCTESASEDEEENVIESGDKPKPPEWVPTTTTTTTTTTTMATTTVQPEPLSGYFKIVCYFTNWAWYRRGLGKYTPEHIDANMCTHIVYGFAVLDYENLIVKAHDSWADFDNKFYERVVAYKAKGLKVSLALGGWNDSQGDKYSRLVNNPAARARFIKHVLEFLEKYNFDGLDLDWEYPKCWQVDCNKGPDSDKPAFAAFVTELHQAFEPKGLLLSAAVSPSKTVIDAGYDVPAMARNLDWVAVMTYDFHGQWDKQTGHVAPLYYHDEDAVTFFNANFSINYWISEGVPRRKIVMGMPLYGQSFQLERTENNGLNAKAPGPGQAGEFTRAAGFLAYYEICDKIKNHGWTVVHDPKNRMGPYAYKGNQWVSFDDPEMIRRKSQYIRDMDLGGGMIWALDLDDFRNRCGEGHHPLLSVIRETLRAPGTGVQVQEEEMESESMVIKPGSKPEVVPEAKPEEMKPDSKPEKPVGGVEPVELPKPDVPVVEVSTSTSTSTSVMGDEYKVVCYFTNWAWYRQGGGKYLPGDIDPDLCTHIVYGFAVLNGDQLIIKPHDTWADFDNKFYEKVTALRAKGVKVLIAIGGWNDSAGDKYSRLVNNPSARRKFIIHVVDFINKNNFDGLDLDWEYPKCWQVDCNKGPDSDKEAFADFVKELRAAFDAEDKGWLLSAAVSPAKKVVDAGYDVKVLSDNLDWIAVMCYDYHGQWDKITGHVAPMYPHDEDIDVTFNANFTMHYWIDKGADRKKLVMGMPMYGQSFSLAENNVNGLNSPTYGGGEAGEATRARGFLSYYEICTNIQKKGWKVVRDPKGRMGPYAYQRDQWVSFDDISMIQHKSEYIKAMGLGGGMIWALDLDDFKNICGCEEYPLLRTINRVLRGYSKHPMPSCQLERTVYTQQSLLQPSVRKPCNGNIFAAHESNCNKYYLCNQGEFMEQRCPAGLHWNKDRCDWPANSGCTSTQTETEFEDEITQELTTENKVDAKPSTIKPTSTVKPVFDGTGYKVICYFTNWAWYRQGDGKYLPSDIDENLCTHINYGFAVLDGSTLTIKPHDSWADIDNEFYRKVTALRAKGIKVLIAIGGWNDSLGDKYSRLVNSASARARFIKNVIEFIEKWEFDGLDLDWEYPKCWQVDCTKGPDSDKQGFTALVRELSEAFKPRGWLLSAAVSPSKAVIDAGYEVAELSKYFDWIAVMTYDFHGHWDKKTGHVAPLYYVPGDTYDYFNANFSLHYWLEKGADSRKIIMGMPLYGQSFSLADSNNRDLNSASYGPGEAGEFTRAGGFLAFYEVCERVKNRGWNVVRDSEGRIGPYAYNSNQWVSYDDVSEIVRKSNLVKEMNLGGGMIWALDLDDFRNRCGCGKHPLLKAMNNVLRGTSIDTKLTDCT